ncbi:hypothetical protein O4158_20950 [Gordonia amicalis]|uniref:Uncharacterized protein n=1 Tax=Gordonia amicalis TaxID=89053 RepID=A0ABU4DJS7_9ACTN|nr:hypothetical protein [Gordonia amicalis]MCZ4581508.1 hypothetical protein [Gordonia amicalis]MDV6310010.1 hypothetical protein [Gordonia amicalis]
MHDDIRFGISNFRSIEPGDPDAANETPQARHGNSAQSRRRPRST